MHLVPVCYEEAVSGNLLHVEFLAMLCEHERAHGTLCAFDQVKSPPLLFSNIVLQPPIERNDSR